MNINDDDYRRQLVVKQYSTRMRSNYVQADPRLDVAGQTKTSAEQAALIDNYLHKKKIRPQKKGYLVIEKASDVYRTQRPETQNETWV